MSELKPKCVHQDMDCPNGNHYEGYDEDTQYCFRRGGPCRYRVIYTPKQRRESHFPYTMKVSPHWSISGCKIPGRVAIDETALNAIRNWAGDSTEPSQVRDKDDQYEKMWNALDMIYKLLDDLQEGDLELPYEDFLHKDQKTITLRKIEKLEEEASKP